jgi:O-antigen/teichoic acid export membrane protein
MSTSQAVARGTTRLLAGLLSAKALDFTFYLVLARRLGVEEFGRFVFAVSFTLLFTIVADLGVCTLVTREAARAPHRIRALLGYALTAKGVLAAVTIAATLGISLATRVPAHTLPLIAVLTAGMLLNSTAYLFESLLRSAGRAGQSGATVFFQSVTALGVGAVLVFSGAGAAGGACAYLGAAVVHLTLSAVWSRDLWRRRAGEETAAAAPGPAAPVNAPAAPAAAADAMAAPAAPVPAAPQAPALELNWRSLLRESAPLALSGVFIAVYFRIDSVLLRALQGERAVGLYGAVYRFFEAFVLFSAAYRSVLFPIMARAADGPAEGLGVLCRKSLRLHLMFTVGIAVFFTLQAQRIVTVVLGPAYAPAAAPLAILIWALPGAFMADTLLHLLAAQRRQHITARAMAITAAFNLAANLALIPFLSFVGAAIVTVASEALSFALMFLAFRPTVPRMSLLQVARAPVLAGAIACGVMLLLSPLDPGGAAGLAVMALFAASAYLLALIGLGALGRREAELVSELLPRGLVPGAFRERRRP